MYYVLFKFFKILLVLKLIEVVLSYGKNKFPRVSETLIDLKLHSINLMILLRIIEEELVKLKLRLEMGYCFQTYKSHSSCRSYRN